MLVTAKVNILRDWSLSRPKIANICGPCAVNVDSGLKLQCFFTWQPGVFSRPHLIRENWLNVQSWTMCASLKLWWKYLMSKPQQVHVQDVCTPDSPKIFTMIYIGTTLVPPPDFRLFSPYSSHQNGTLRNDETAKGAAWTPPWPFPACWVAGLRPG